MKCYKLELEGLEALYCHKVLKVVCKRPVQPVHSSGPAHKTSRARVCVAHPDTSRSLLVSAYGTIPDVGYQELYL